jgi:TolB protein
MLALLAFIAAFAGSIASAHAQSGQRIAFAAYRSGQWDIYSLDPTGADLRRLTNDSFEDTDPAYSPDGRYLAYASRRNQNWDVYALNLATGEETRLTTSPHYDGSPTWQPNGQLLAYESYQAGNLDIWQVDAAAAEPPANLTAASEAGDFGPAYSPDGTRIAFSSWRSENKELYLLDMTTGQTSRLTTTPTAEDAPAWRPDGQALAFVTDDLGDREIFSLTLTPPLTETTPAEPITWLGRTDGPAYSPDGQTIAAIFHRWDGEQLTLTQPGQPHRLSTEITGVVTLQGRLTWHSAPLEFGVRVADLTDSGPSPLYVEQAVRNDDPAAEPYSMVRQNDIKTGTPWLADTVDDSFAAWRQRMRAEVGYDFLSELSDALRDVGAYTETSQYASWHKSGRAIDTLFDYHIDGQLLHEIVREDYSGETYWRIYLRCVDQSGACGRPVTGNPWNYSYRARVEIAPGQGGTERANLSGYYLDMTALSREYGWDRISSYDDAEFGWTWNFLAFEYWHIQKRYETNNAVNWYGAMREVYPQKTLDRFFTWEEMRRRDENPHLIALKGIPLPLEQQPWWQMVEP